MRKLLPILLLMLLLGASCAQTDVGLEMRQAREKASQKQYAEALVHTQKCLDFAPDMTDAILLHNFCLLQGTPPENVRNQVLYNLSKVTKACPDRYDTWLFQGWALVQCRQYRDAIAPLEKALELAPKDSPHILRIRLLLGNCYFHNNLQQKAMGILQPLQAREPYKNLPELYNCLGILALQRQNQQGAVAFFKRGAQLAPTNEILLQNLAVAYDLYCNDVENAREAYLQCLIQKQARQDSIGANQIVKRLYKLSNL